MTADDGLRETIAQALADSDASAHGTYTWGECGWELRDDYRRYADVVLALPEVAAPRAKADAADRVRELAGGDHRGQQASRANSSLSPPLRRRRDPPSPRRPPCYLAVAVPPHIAHAIARWLGIDTVIAMFCPHCPEWADWAEEVEEAAA